MAKRLIFRNPSEARGAKRALRAFGIKFNTKKLKPKKRRARPRRRKKSSSRRRSRRSKK